MVVNVILEGAARGLARALTAWLRRDTVPELEQSAWQRGAIDTRRWANDHAIAFTLWLALPGGGAATAATLLTTDASVGVQIVAGAVGALIGALVGVLAALLVATAAAPIRQRDEARARLRDDGYDPLPQLAQDLEAFAVASRATTPRTGIELFIQTVGMERNDRARFMQELNAEADKAMRGMRREYHDKFRARVLAELHKTGRESLLGAHGDVAGDPRRVDDIEKLSRTISRLARAQAERPGVLGSTDEPTRAALADEMRVLASDVEVYLEQRDDEARVIDQEMLHRHHGTLMTPADRQELEWRADKHRRESEVAFYINFQERGLALFDRAHAIGLVGSDERAQIEHPRGKLEPIAPWLRDLATDLDGQAS